MKSGLKTAFLTLWAIMGTGCTIHSVALQQESEPLVAGLVPPAPDYADSTQWFIRDRGADVDLFYIISTETGFHMVGTDTCHFADTHDDYLRNRMRHEMHAVDSFYSGRLNYFSPYYRQISLQSWAVQDTALARLPIALYDCRRSWDYYIKHLNHGRPFIIAGFSQGAHALMDVMHHMPDSVAKRMVAVYCIGYKVTAEDTAACHLLRPAKGATDTGVTINFNSVKTPEAEIDVVSKGNLFCINPINWRTDTVSAPFIYYSRKKNDTLTAQLDPESRLLLISGFTNDKPKAIIGKPGNYHHLELKLFYPYIRQNMADRVAAFMAKKEE